MKFTLSWLKDHLETTASLEEICTRLVELGLEVEEVDNPAEKFNGFLVGQVVKHVKHPNADRLNLCQVDIGGAELIQVICGASNVRVGMKTVFANIGAIIPATGQALKKGKIRGVESFGMLCSAMEMQSGNEEEGIIDLAIDATSGTPLIEVRDFIEGMNFNNDPIIEVAITPDRGDCFGIRGIARDLAASGLGKLRPLPYQPVIGTFDSPIQVNIENADACQDFRGVHIKGLSNGQSPDRIQKRLKAIGLRPINALVDITNYLAYDLCRPLHVFDAAKLISPIMVRFAKAGETLQALNGKTYSLNEEMTVIADADKVLALGGLMGGAGSSCTEETTEVFLECALFDPIRTANTGRRLNLISDARTRFERGVDPGSQAYGLSAAINLILDWCGGSASHIIPATPSLAYDAMQAPLIRLTHEKLLRLSGCDISMEQAAKALQKLGFKVNHNLVQLEAVVPSHRFNIESPTDLITEILRLHGYDNIPTAPAATDHPDFACETKSDITRHVLAGRGFNETITWSFLAKEKAILFGEIDPELVLLNPINQDLSVMRSTTLPNLIDAVERNAFRAMESMQLFEVGPNYTTNLQSLLANQHMVATGIRSGCNNGRHWLKESRVVDFYDVKADVIAVLAKLGIKEADYQLVAEGSKYYHPSRKGTIKQGNKNLACFGELNPEILSQFSIDIPVVAFEIFLDNIPNVKSKKYPLKLSSYQRVTRDFAFLVDKDIKAGVIVQAIQKVDKQLITGVNVFDVYTKMADEDKKSIAVDVKMEPTAGTMTDAEIQDISSRIIDAVAKATGATLRK